MNFVKTLFGKTTDLNQLKLKKESTGEWAVRKGSTILYIGTRDKCETYMNQARIA